MLFLFTYLFKISNRVLHFFLFYFNFTHGCILFESYKIVHHRLMIIICSQISWKPTITTISSRYNIRTTSWRKPISLQLYVYSMLYRWKRLIPIMRMSNFIFNLQWFLLFDDESFSILVDNISWRYVLFLLIDFILKRAISTPSCFVSRQEQWVYLFYFYLLVLLGFFLVLFVFGLEGIASFTVVF